MAVSYESKLFYFLPSLNVADSTQPQVVLCKNRCLKMSEKRLSKATRKRLPRIIEGILNEENYDDIAEALGLKNRRTIERDVQAWRQSGGFEEFLTNQWMKLHGKIKEMDPVEAYRQITKLLGKTLTQKIKSEISGGEIVIKMWEPPKEDANSK